MSTAADQGRSAAASPPPNSPDAEIAVLGAIVCNGAMLDAACALITPDDFYQRRHGILFRAMTEMAAAGTPVDFVTVQEWLEARELTELAGGTDYFLSLLSSAIPHAVEAHARIVRDCATRRSAIEIARRIATQARDRSIDAAEVVDQGVAELMGLHRTHVSCEWTMRQTARMVVEDLQAAEARGGALTGITTGLVDMDEVLGGLQPSDLTVLGARPAMGKTALMLNWAMAGAAAGHPVGVISGEQPVRQIGLRLLSLRSRVEANRLRTAKIDEDEWGRVTDGSVGMCALPMWIYDRSAPSITELARIARKWRQQHGIKALYVDYLQRVQSDSDAENKAERVGEVAMGLKNLARDLDISVVALAQVKREVETRTNKRPRMGDLSDSSGIEKEADQIILLYRDEVYNSESPDAGVAELLIDKNRHGPIGIVRAGFHVETMRFVNLGGVEDYHA